MGADKKSCSVRHGKGTRNVGDGCTVTFRTSALMYLKKNMKASKPSVYININTIV